MKITVPDMTCGGCAAAVERAIRLIDAQAGVRVDLVTKVVEIDSSASVEQLRDAIQGAGFTPQAVTL